MRVYQRLKKYPIEVKQLGDYFVITMKDSVYNVSHADGFQFATYSTREDAEKAVEAIKRLAEVEYV